MSANFHELITHIGSTIRRLAEAPAVYRHVIDCEREPGGEVELFLTSSLQAITLLPSQTRQLETTLLL